MDKDIQNMDEEVVNILYTIEYYSAIKKELIWVHSNEVGESGAYYRESVSQKEKDQYRVLTHIYGILKEGNDDPIWKTEKETQM